MTYFQDLNGFEDTKATLHYYSKVVGVVPRAFALPHPKWWHISLQVVPNGLITQNMPLPDGGIFYLKMNFYSHRVVLVSSAGKAQSFDMTAGLTATQFGNRILEAVARLGLTAEYARDKFENDEPRTYNPQAASTYFETLTRVYALLAQHRHGLTGEVSPVQLWPHHFDLSIEWFGTRTVAYEEHGKVTQYPSQLNFGFSPGDPSEAPYFYSNPFPFEEAVTQHALPAGARWCTDSWKGSILPYAPLVGDKDAGKKVLSYAKAVYEIASPLLMAE